MCVCVQCFVKDSLEHVVSIVMYFLEHLIRFGISQGVNDVKWMTFKKDAIFGMLTYFGCTINSCFGFFYQ